MVKSQERIYATSDTVIRGTLISPVDAESPRPGILMLHGYDSTKEGAVERATELIESSVNISALAVDLGGHGGSTVYDNDKKTPICKSELPISIHLNEVMRSYEVIRDAPGVDRERIGVVGASYGGYLALLLATDGDHPVKSLLLRAPAIYPDGLEDTPRSEYPDEAATFQKDLNAIKASEAWDRIEGYEGPLWVVESGADESIPSSVIDAYEQGSQNPTRLVLPGATHSLQNDEHKALYQSYLTDWAKDL